MSEEKPWWRRVLTIADIGVYAVDEVLRLDAAELAEMKRRLGFNAEHLSCSDVYGGEKGVFYFKTKIAESVPRDFLGEYLPEAKRRGIRSLIYYNVHWLQLEFGMKHRDWLQVDSRGHIIDDLYGSGCAPCVNSPWRDWSFQGIRDMAAYDIDGIFLDGPIFAPAGCYCESCRRLFRARFGAEIPAKEDWQDPVWRKFLEFRYASIAEYLRDAANVLKSAKPGCIIYMNCTGLWPAWPAARSNRRLVPHQDMLGAEGGFLYYDLRTSPLWKPGMTAKLLETQAAGKPTVIFIAGANKGWDEYLLTPAETKLLYADTIANGASPWYGIPLHCVGAAGARAAAEMNHFILRNAEYFESTVPLANVALLWSDRTADYYRATVPVTDFTPQGERLEKREAAGNFYSGFLGCYEAMARSHIPFRILDEDAVTPKALDAFDLLVAPNCACLSQKKAKAIDRYVREGGNLIASFETSRYDENGILLEDFSLSRVFGVEAGKGTFGPLKLDYMSITDLGSPITQDLSSSLLPCPTYGMEVLVRSAIPLAMYREKMPARYAKLPPVSDKPAIVSNKYGKGRCLYIAGNFFEHYHGYHNPDYRRIVSNSAQAMAKPLVSLRDCPSSVEVVLRAQPGNARLLVHLINFTGEMTRPMERVVSIRNLELTLHDFAGLRKARALHLGRDLRLRRFGSDALLSIPRLEEYEVISLEPLNARLV